MKLPLEVRGDVGSLPVLREAWLEAKRSRPQANDVLLDDESGIRVYVAEDDGEDAGGSRERTPCADDDLERAWGSWDEE
jgi:hypothetical protein